MPSGFSGAAIFEVEPQGQLRLDASAVIALSSAYRLFEKTGQDLNNFDLHVIDRKKENVEDEGGADTIGIVFSAKLAPGQKGLGNASKLGRSVMYIASRATGEILREQGSR
ncbi:hypothetical protein [Variovorax sp. Root434]|uniref:hypothetical protein n=1 Tax=unclassified Variovorax TaxID=663243 RepID=UPI0006F91C74|nr:hypothetical protein [Variovorax sp. Root434]KQX29282.1 hypothetical protein ASD05_03680 [Variovorax sp. Root434]